MNKDEKELQKILTKKFSAHAEEKFWDRFEREAGTDKKPIWGYFISGLAVASLTVVIVMNQTGQESQADIAMAMQNQELLSDLEFYAELDESMIQLSQEDWDILLKDQT